MLISLHHKQQFNQQNTELQFLKTNPFILIRAKQNQNCSIANRTLNGATQGTMIVAQKLAKQSQILPKPVLRNEASE
jgi:hypothetical protein